MVGASVLQLRQIVRSVEINDVVEPIVVKHIGVGTPQELRLLCGVVIGEVVAGNIGVDAFGYVTHVFLHQCVTAVFRVTRNEDVTAVLVGNDKCASLLRFCKYHQLVDLADLLDGCLGIS